MRPIAELLKILAHKEAQKAQKQAEPIFELLCIFVVKRLIFPVDS